MNLLNKLIAPHRVFYDFVRDGILICELSGEVIYLNKSVCNILRCDKKVLLKKNLNDCFPDEVTLDQVLEHLASSETWIQSVKCKLIDGSENLLILCFSVIKDIDVQPIGIQIVVRDQPLTEMLPTILENQSSMLQTLNHRSREVIIISDLKSMTNLFCTKNIEKIIGWKQKNVVDGGWAFMMSLTHPDDTALVVETFVAGLELRKKEKYIYDNIPTVYSNRIRHKNGEWIWIKSESLILERDNDGDAQILITFIQNTSFEKNNTGTSNNSTVTEILEEQKLANHEKTNNQSGTSSVHLSHREKEVLELIKKGLSTKEIADVLDLKITTINTYRKNLMDKMKVKNSAELVARSNQIQIN